MIDRVLLEERHKQAGTLALSFPWEQGIFKEILGSTAGLPTLPVVEVPLNLPSSSSATLDDFVQVARAAATTEASIANHYRLAVERATWRARSKLSVGEQVTLVCQKFDLILAHDYGRSVVGRTIKELSSTARVDVIADFGRSCCQYTPETFPSGIALHIVVSNKWIGGVSFALRGCI